MDFVLLPILTNHFKEYQAKKKMEEEVKVARAKFLEGKNKSSIVDIKFGGRTFDIVIEKNKSTIQFGEYDSHLEVLYADDVEATNTLLRIGVDERERNQGVGTALVDIALIIVSPDTRNWRIPGVTNPIAHSFWDSIIERYHPEKILTKV